MASSDITWYRARLRCTERNYVVPSEIAWYRERDCMVPSEIAWYRASLRGTERLSAPSGALQWP